MELSERWQFIFADVARSLAKASKDPSTQVGAVIYRPDKSIASMGFNGLPPDMIDSPSILNNRDEKLRHMIHAERNAIRFSREDLTGYGIVTTFIPCADCARRIVNEGISTVYYIRASDELMERWSASIKESNAIFENADVKLFEIPNS